MNVSLASIDSSLYTVSMKEPKNRYVFTLNTKRYPDFEGMIKTFRKSGIKISPNIKPFVLCSVSRRVESTAPA